MRASAEESRVPSGPDDSTREFARFNTKDTKAGRGAVDLTAGFVPFVVNSFADAYFLFIVKLPDVRITPRLVVLSPRANTSHCSAVVPATVDPLTVPVNVRDAR